MALDSTIDSAIGSRIGDDLGVEIRSESEIERIRREHALLVESIQITPMPFAVYDDADRLIAWNDPYERVHAQAFERLRERAQRRELRYADLVRVTAEATMPPEKVEDYIRDRVAAQRAADGQGVDREYPGAGWFRISKFRTRSGAVAGFAIDITELKRREARLEEEIRHRQALEDRLRMQMNTDALTQVASRGAFLAQAEADFQRARQVGDELSVIMMDADHFKAVNDVHGHAVGDSVLVAIARTASAMLRQGLDLVGRLGGEEFAMVLVRTGCDDARACAERIRAGIAALDFGSRAGTFGVTASIGVANRLSSDVAFAAMLNRADQALYQAKRAGRDRVVVASGARVPLATVR